jgi:SAM-dependent methyltransferase
MEDAAYQVAVVGRVATARESNAAAAQRRLWSALDTTCCGQPQVVCAFLASLEADRRIVDVGCWNGAIAALAADCIAGGASPDRGARQAPWRSYLGVDVVPEAVREFTAAHDSRPRTTAVEGDVRALPIEDDAADAVLCLFVLQDLEGHRSDGVAALRELARIASPGARVLVGLTVHSSREEETFYVVRKLRAEGIPEKPTHHWRRSDFLVAVQECGFRIVKSDEFGPNDRGFVEVYLDLVNEGIEADDA